MPSNTPDSDKVSNFANTSRGEKALGKVSDAAAKMANDAKDSVADFAAQKPLAFFGCGILAGLLVSRLISSSNR